MLVPLSRGGSAGALICFPPIGAGAEYFRSFARRMPDHQVYAVDYPQWARLYREPMATEIGVLSAELAEAMAPLPLGAMFLGHRFGVQMSITIAEELTRRGNGAPGLLVLSGRNGPTAPFQNAEQSRGPWRQELAADLLLVCGRDDTQANLPSMSGWANRTTGRSRFLLLPGGDDAVRETPQILVDALSRLDSTRSEPSAATPRRSRAMH